PYISTYLAGFSASRSQERFLTNRDSSLDFTKCSPANVHTGVIKSLSEAVHSTAGGRKRLRLLCRDGAANMVATKEQRHDWTNSTAKLLDDGLSDHCRSIQRLPGDDRRDGAGSRARLRLDHR